MTRPILTIGLLLANVFISLGQIKVQEIKIDLQLTGFKFAKDMDGMLVYLPNGKADLESKGDPSSFSIHTEPDMTYERSVGYIDYQMDYSKRHGAILSDILKKDTTIHGYSAYEVTFTEQTKGFTGKRLNYYAFFLKGSTAIIFLSGDTENGKYIQKLKTTFRKTSI